MNEITPEEIFEIFRQDQESEDLQRIRGEVEEQVEELITPPTNDSH